MGEYLAALGWLRYIVGMLKEIPPPTIDLDAGSYRVVALRTRLVRGYIEIFDRLVVAAGIWAGVIWGIGRMLKEYDPKVAMLSYLIAAAVPILLLLLLRLISPGADQEEDYEEEI